MTFVARDADKMEKLIKLSMLKLSPALGVHRNVPFSISITRNTLVKHLEAQDTRSDEAAVIKTVSYVPQVYTWDIRCRENTRTVRKLLLENIIVMN